jgi:hypothetical protein
MFKSHLIKLNHRFPRKKVDTFGAPVLPLMIVPLFKRPKCVLTPMNNLCILDFYDLYIMFGQSGKLSI